MVVRCAAVDAWRVKGDGSEAKHGLEGCLTCTLWQDSARRRQLRRALVRLHKKTQGLVGHAVPTDPLRGALNGHGAVGGSETDALPGVSGYAVEALAKESGRRGGSGDALVGDGAGLQYHHATVIDEGQVRVNVCPRVCFRGVWAGGGRERETGRERARAHRF